MSGYRTLADTAAREVRAEMARQRMAGTALAQALGVSDMYISRRLTGEVPFDLADLEKVADALSVPVVQFLNTEAAAA